MTQPIDGFLRGIDEAQEAELTKKLHLAELELSGWERAKSPNAGPARIYVTSLQSGLAAVRARLAAANR